MGETATIDGARPVVLGDDHVPDPEPCHCVLHRLVDRAAGAHVVEVKPILTGERFVGARVTAEENREVTTRKELPHVKGVPHHIVLADGVDGEAPCFRATAICREHDHV